ncbi:MAG: carbohydrate porin [Usitatibacter sp.]
MNAAIRSAAAAALFPCTLCAQAPADALPPEEQWSLHGQSTYVFQAKPPFPEAYSGPNSLRADRARNYSFTATLFAGVRAWDGGELYINPEVVQGVSISDLTGLGGFPDAELQRTAGATLKWYRARAFLRHTIGLGGAAEAIEPDANQLGGAGAKRRLVITAGNLSVMDLFDDNKYAHDARADFLNWSLVTSGAYDFAADARGYSWGIAAEWFDAGWAIRAGRFLQPRESNGLPLDFAIFRHYGDQVELERAHEIRGLPGKLRLLAFRNVAEMGRYRDALELARDTGDDPQVSAVRRRNVKYGFVANLEQELGAGLGGFAKASWNTGETETYAFAEIDRSIAAGLNVSGARWGREGDTFAAALVRNGLSGVHREYLAAGGLGFFIGDGRLRYRPEDIAEAYYLVTLAKGLAATFDWQRVRNPAYNADRGPVSFYGVRLHAEF